MVKGLHAQGPGPSTLQTHAYISVRVSVDRSQPSQSHKMILCLSLLVLLVQWKAPSPFLFFPLHPCFLAPPSPLPSVVCVQVLTLLISTLLRSVGTTLVVLLTQWTLLSFSHVGNKEAQGGPMANKGGA